MAQSIDGRTAMAGTSDFRELRAGNGYYIDKTALIDRVLGDGRRSHLFMRPNGFGKSLGLSTLDAYLNIRYADDPDYFEGLEIERLRPRDPERHANTVIRMDLGDLGGLELEGFYIMLGARMAEVYRGFPELGSSCILNEEERDRYTRIASGSLGREGLMRSLLDLARMLEKEHGRRVAVLIDRYDAPVAEAVSQDTRREILGFMSGFLLPALEDEGSVKLAVLAGMTLAVLTGTEGACIDSVLSPGPEEPFGFTEDEAMRACTDFGGADRFPEIMEWYGGYVLGTIRVCSPGSVMRCLDHGFETGPYSMDDSVLEQLYGSIGMDNFEQVLALFSGRSFDTGLCGSPYGEGRTALYSRMVLAGCLSASPRGDGVFAVSFTDKEARRAMRQTIERMNPLKAEDQERLRKAVLKGDTARISRAMGEMLVRRSCWDLEKVMTYEQVPMTIVFSISGYYRFEYVQDEDGSRADITMTPKRPGLPNIIWEIQTCDSDNRLGTTARSALDHIRDRRRYVGMEGAVLLYAVAFCGRITARMRHRVIELPPTQRIS